MVWALQWFNNYRQHQTVGFVTLTNLNEVKNQLAESNQTTPNIIVPSNSVFVLLILNPLAMKVNHYGLLLFLMLLLESQLSI